MVALILQTRAGVAALALLAAVGFYEVYRVPSERAEAVAGMVAASWKARAAELQRQIDAGRAATDKFNRDLATAQAAQKVSSDIMEREIAEYQARIRTCDNAFNGDDIEWLRGGKAGSGGAR